MVEMMLNVATLIYVFTTLQRTRVSLYCTVLPTEGPNWTHKATATVVATVVTLLQMLQRLLHQQPPSQSIRTHQPLHFPTFLGESPGRNRELRNLDCRHGDVQATDDP